MSHSHLVLFTAGSDGNSIPCRPNLSALPLLNRGQQYHPDHLHLRGHDRAPALPIPTTPISLPEVVLTQDLCLQDRSCIALVQSGAVVGRLVTGDGLATAPRAGIQGLQHHLIVAGPCVKGVATALLLLRL